MCHHLYCYGLKRQECTAEGETTEGSPDLVMNPAFSTHCSLLVLLVFYLISSLVGKIHYAKHGYS
jgi:hypothetical protein